MLQDRSGFSPQRLGCSLSFRLECLRLFDDPLGSFIGFVLGGFGFELGFLKFLLGLFTAGGSVQGREKRDE